MKGKAVGRVYYNGGYMDGVRVDKISCEDMPTFKTM